MFAVSVDLLAGARSPDEWTLRAQFSCFCNCIAAAEGIYTYPQPVGNGRRSNQPNPKSWMVISARLWQAIVISPALNRICALLCQSRLIGQRICLPCCPLEQSRTSRVKQSLKDKRVEQSGASAPAP